MKNPNLTTLLISAALFLGLGVSNLLHAQGTYRLTGKPVLTVMGGSTIHDWEMSSAQSQGRAEILVDGTSLKHVKSANVTMKAESLKSGKDKMDGIAYDALKTKKHPDILFTLTSFKSLGGNKGLATGNLTIAGTTKPVAFKVESSTKGDMVYLSGETAIKFTDFNITPPTAMLGTIKTSNDLKLLFKVNFQQAVLQ
ncbi:YceI family protein [Pontibacter roseus]|uniref:YceI family protein n=1 Tax=Pontibacter roseus TaxID=336989 RepID=UPI00035E2FAC|nr:YceI family protein [Pontibacter roseus]